MPLNRSSSSLSIFFRNGSRRLFRIMSLAFVAGGFLMASAPQAWGVPLIYAGWRDSNGQGVISDDDWSNSNGGFRLNFYVEWTGNAWAYTYKFYNLDESALKPTIGDFLKLNVSDVPGAIYELISDGNTPGYKKGDLIPLTPHLMTFKLWDSSTPSYSMFGVVIGDHDPNKKDELADGAITILSTQAPTWGSFYARGGDSSKEPGVGPAEAINTGFNDGLFKDPKGKMMPPTGEPPKFDPNACMDDPSLLAWILVPDTCPFVIPEPSSILLGIQAGLLGLFWIHRRAKRKAAA